MRARKPKLASGERVIVDVSDGSSPGLGSGTGVISTGGSTEPLPKRAIRSVIGFIVLGALTIFLTYVVLATTVLVVMRADGNQVAVLRNTFPIGQAPAQALVYASSAPADHSLLGKVNQAVFGVPAGSVVQLVAGPTAVVSTNKDGYIVADGKATPFQGQVDTRRLSREYVAICISGACQQDKAVILQQGNIIGEVKGYLGFGGLTTPATPVPTDPTQTIPAGPGHTPTSAAKTD